MSKLLNSYIIILLQFQRNKLNQQSLSYNVKSILYNLEAYLCEYFLKTIGFSTAYEKYKSLIPRMFLEV